MCLRPLTSWPGVRVCESLCKKKAEPKQHVESLLRFPMLIALIRPLELEMCFITWSNCIHLSPQVQNMTQSIQVLDQRTQRDLQYVEKMEVQLRGLETKFRQVEENHKQNIAKQYKVLSQILN